MRHDEKPPGMTLAEALGIKVPDDAPGGARIFPSASAGAQRTTAQAKLGTEIEYEGFHDVDGYGRAAR